MSIASGSLTTGLITAAIAAATLSGAGAATADVMVPLGGGSGIVLSNRAICSLTTIGYDNAGRLVGLTAGHCAPEGTRVAAEINRGAGAIGTVAYSDNGRDLDYAVIEFDPARVVPTRTVGGTTIAGTAPAPGMGSQVCVNGRSTGYNCSINWGPFEDVSLSQVCSNHGDSGGPVTAGDRLIGMLQGGIVGYDNIPLDFPCTNPANPLHSPTFYRPIDDILTDINVAGRTGAGYHPV
ncbi:S1 family peptidase [Nocardia tengchongensis]|uniref:S1 family peptidase n=1 Tax=Nocardia tengchongensis TaxID=2055889 RepID=UPI003678508A